MSGPKTINIRIHDRSLMLHLENQAKIRVLMDQLEQFCILDNELGIDIRGKTYLSFSSKQISQAMQGVTIPPGSELTHGQNSKFAEELIGKSKAQSELITKLQGLLSDCKKQETAYRRSRTQYLASRCLADGARKQLTTMKTEVLKHLEANKHKLREADYNSAKAKLGSMPLQLKLPDFTIHYHSRADTINEQLLAQKQALQQEIYQWQADYCNNMNFLEIPDRAQMLTAKETGDLHEIKQFLNELAGKVDCARLQREYERMSACPEKPSSAQCRHLKSELSMMKASIDRRYELQNKLQDISLLPPSPEQEALIADINTEAAKEIIAESHHAKLCLASEALIADNLKNRTEKYQKEQELAHIKTKLVEALQLLNYEVVTDTEVVDFTADNFVLKIPNQDNYIAVEYLKGKFYYNFMVPEQISELSREELRRKVAEMAPACDGFLQALNSLLYYGISFDYQHLEASENRVISIPQTLRDKLGIAKTSSQADIVNRKQKMRMDHD